MHVWTLSSWKISTIEPKDSKDLHLFIVEE